MYSDITEAWDSPLHRQIKTMQEEYAKNKQRVLPPWNADEDETALFEARVKDPKSVDPNLDAEHMTDQMSFYTSQGEYIPSKDEFEEIPREPKFTRKMQCNSNFNEIKPNKYAESPFDEDDFNLGEVRPKKRHNKKKEKFISVSRPINNQRDKPLPTLSSREPNCRTFIEHVRHCEFCLKNLRDVIEVKPQVTGSFSKWYQSDDVKDIVGLIVVGIILIFAFDICLRIGKMFHKK